MRPNASKHEDVDWLVEEEDGNDTGWLDDSEAGIDVEKMFDNEEASAEVETVADSDDELKNDAIPDGWTSQQYASWLDGPTPEGWTENEWAEYVSEHKTKLSSQDNPTEG